MLRRVGRCAQAGAGVIEPLVAVAILSIGLLFLARFQLNSIVQSSDAHRRLSAMIAAEDLLTLVRSDIGSAACYQVPTPASGCSNDSASKLAKEWSTRTSSSVAGLVSAESKLTDNTLVVTIKWSSKGSDDSHILTEATDVRQ